LIPLLLRIELHAEESFLLNSVPAKAAYFFHSSAGVQPEKKIAIIWERRAQLCLHEQDIARKGITRVFMRAPLHLF
jgi:hypothetical protein